MRCEKNLLLNILVIATTFAFSACQESVAENKHVSSTVSPVQTSSKTPVSPSDSSIRKIDFSNFSYPWTEDFSNRHEKFFTLKNGEIPFKRDGQMGISLGKIEYADVTGEGADEAILIISIQSGGTAIPNIVYVYTVENENPKILWSFDTGDRAQGGLKKVYAENGNLIVETFGSSKFENEKWNFKFPEKFAGYCCPTAYTEIRFKWNGKKFVVQGKPELFDYDMNKETGKNQ